ERLKSDLDRLEARRAREAEEAKQKAATDQIAVFKANAEVRDIQKKLEEKENALADAQKAKNAEKESRIKGQLALFRRQAQNSVLQRNLQKEKENEESLKNAAKEKEESLKLELAKAVQKGDELQQKQLRMELAMQKKNLELRTREEALNVELERENQLREEADRAKAEEEEIKLKAAQEKERVEANKIVVPPETVVKEEFEELVRQSELIHAADFAKLEQTAEEAGDTLRREHERRVANDA
ncbi:unnamed protein product, partial [Amoebophrya sp. A25]